MIGEGRVEDRRCLQCDYRGEMKTWLKHYNLPQLIALIMLVAYVVPGLIFIAWAYGKYKCPNCGALAKNVPYSGEPATMTSQTGTKTQRIERPCPWCAEPILVQATVCKHCGRDV